MSANSILPFAQAVGANVQTDAAYNSSATRTQGNQPGIADAQVNNKALRQASAIAAGMAQFLADHQGTDVADSLTPSVLSAMMSAALQAAGVLVTPAQFDSSTKPSTTEFVQRALGSYSGVRPIFASVALVASDMGKLILADATAATRAVTLPPTAGLTVGAAVQIYKSDSSANVVTVPVANAAGGEAINGVNNFNGGSGTTSITLRRQGDFVELVCTGTGWFALNASGGGTIAPTGYQRLASGVMVQWGSINNVQTTSPLPLTFPIAFPNASWALVLTGWDPGSIFTHQQRNAANAQITRSGTAGGFNFDFFVIGW